MTYFGFLALFLGLPILLLAAAARNDNRRDRRPPPAFGTFSPAAVILFHVVVALFYTTPWDNYLVATGVWWYDPELVAGVTFGWVPLEEYVFFILQPILTGLWLLFAGRRLSSEGENGSQPHQGRPALRWAAVLVAGLIWSAAVAILVARWQPGTYLALELGWALPPIILQLAFGADILWHHRRLVLLALLPPTLYLAAADAVAIGAGTWTIDPAQSVGLYLGGVLPLEEFVFFLLTNTLIVFGVTLALSRESASRLPNWITPREEGAILRSHPFAGNTTHTHTGNNPLVAGANPDTISPMTDEAKTRTCEICKGTMVEEVQDYTVEVDGEQILVEDVPIWVCEQCNFSEVEPDVVEAIEDMLEHMDTVLEDQAPEEGALEEREE